jgi:glycopeptide antibiotics resistance protein
MKEPHRRRNGQTHDFKKSSSDSKNILSRLNREERAFISKLIARDPLSGLYSWSLLVYLLVCILFLLWPFDLALLQKRNTARWLGISNGIEFPQDGQVLSLSSTENLCGRLLMGTGITLEVWVATDSPDQIGPARIVSYSLTPGKRNFTLGQSEKKLIMRLRTTETDLNGKPQSEVDDVFGHSEPLHIVVAYDFSEQRIFVNGELSLQKKIPGGRFTNWDPSYHLVLGNEATGNRPWKGKIFYFAIYNRALNEKEIQKNYRIGQVREGLSSNENPLVSAGLVVRYLFEERNGREVVDHSAISSLNLYIPKIIETYEKAYLSLEAIKSLDKPTLFRETLLNILAFIPLGFLFHAALRIRYGTSMQTSVIVLIVGILFTSGIESLQYLSLARYSSLIDVVNNVLGITTGVALDRFYEACLKRQFESLNINEARPE